jgi:hypothetical protein
MVRRGLGTKGVRRVLTSVVATRRALCSRATEPVSVAIWTHPGRRRAIDRSIGASGIRRKRDSAQAGFGASGIRSKRDSAQAGFGAKRESAWASRARTSEIGAVRPSTHGMRRTSTSTFVSAKIQSIACGGEPTPGADAGGVSPARPGADAGGVSPARPRTNSAARPMLQRTESVRGTESRCRRGGGRGGPSPRRRRGSGCIGTQRRAYVPRRARGSGCPSARRTRRSARSAVQRPAHCAHVATRLVARRRNAVASRTHGVLEGRALTVARPQAWHGTGPATLWTCTNRIT